MFSLLLRAVIAAAFLGTSARSQYQCANAYNPSTYVGNTRVPPNCALETLDCPRSWKAGIPQGQSLGLPLIDVKFVECHEGFLCCGYVPIDNSNGRVLGTSGVTVGSGVDLGSKTGSSLSSIGVPPAIVAQLVQYFGLKQDDAACAAIELPLRMSCIDSQVLTEAVKNDIVLQVQQRYDQDLQRDAEPFASLPRGIRTAIADVWFQFGSSSTPTFSFWGYVTSNDWDNAVKELRDFYGQNANPPPGDIIRRNNEADIIEAALARCNRSADIVFLVDESGSIDGSDFTRSLNFIESIINAFPEETLRDENGTRFGLSLFSNFYRARFYLSTYTSKSQYFSSLRSIIQRTQSTNLGRALSSIRDDQFATRRGLRLESYGFPRILIVMTDGQSSDEVATPAASVRANNVVVYAIGIGDYDINQLLAVASSAGHVHLLDTFSGLTDFAATLTASTCYEPQPISIDTVINGRVQKDEFQFYKYFVPKVSNLQVEVTDTEGSTLLYASRENPHPYEYDSDFGFVSASRRIKILVISPVLRSDDIEKRQLSTTDGNSTHQAVYISVLGATNDVSYTLTGSMCDPAECSEGTNKANFPQATAVDIILIMVVATAMNIF